LLSLVCTGLLANQVSLSGAASAFEGVTGDLHHRDLAGAARDFVEFASHSRRRARYGEERDGSV